MVERRSYGSGSSSHISILHINLYCHSHIVMLLLLFWSILYTVACLWALIINPPISLDTYVTSEIWEWKRRRMKMPSQPHQAGFKKSSSGIRKWLFFHQACTMYCFRGNMCAIAIVCCFPLIYIPVPQSSGWRHPAATHIHCCLNVQCANI